MEKEVYMNGYFTEDEAKTICRVMDNKTYMDFNVTYSNDAGNCIIIIRTRSNATEKEILNVFQYALITNLIHKENM